MIGNLMVRDFAGGSGFGHGVQEVIPLSVTEQVLEVTRQPVYPANLLGRRALSIR